MSRPECVFVVPGDINTQTGGYIYDRKVISELRASGFSVSVLSLSDTFPNPSVDDQRLAYEQLTRVKVKPPMIIDGLALGALDPETVSAISSPIIGMIHHPLAYETGLDADTSRRLFETEFENLRKVDKVIAPSHFIKQLLVEKYQLDKGLITVATPGIDLDPLPASPAQPPLILSVGIMASRKGHDVLLRALSKITEASWQAVIVGSTRDQHYLDDLVALRAELGLESRVKFLGQLSQEELAEYYSRASVFALATRHEGYGMVFAEAMANGLPIVSCKAGATAETVGEQAGILTDVDSPEMFADALRTVIDDRKLHARMSSASKLRASQLGTWSDTASVFEKALDEISERENPLD